MSEQTMLRAWGNSQGIRIPRSILKELDIAVSDCLQIDVENNAIVIRKVFPHKTFEERVAEYGGEITVCDFDWGEAQGKELL